jgi:tetratricopeptide (TPR) repeat protein
MKKGNENKKRSKTSVITFIFLMLIGAMFGLLIGMLIINKSAPIWWIAACIFISFFIVINIHEFGHFIVGKSLGYKLISYRIIIFSFDNVNGKMKLSIKRNKGYGGLCAMMPYDDSLSKMAWYIAGGIILNFVTGILFLAIYMFAPDLNSYASSFFMIFGVISLFLFLMNAIPLTKNNVLTDGTFLYNIILKKPYAKTLANLIKSQTALATGTRPRELDMSLGTNDEFNLTLYLYKYFKAVDIDDKDSVKNIIARLENNIHTANAVNMPPICYEICFQACLCGDTEKAKTYYNKCIKTITKDKDANGMRVKAYYEYYVNNDVEKAKEYCIKGLDVVDKYPILGIALYEKELLIKLQKQL